MSLKHSILALLSREEKTGYELSKDAEGSTRFFWTATHQQIYRELAVLEEERWVRHKEVEQSSKPDKKIYTITEKGLAELKRWANEPTEPSPSRDAFLIKLFVGDLIETKVLLEDLMAHKKIHLERREKYREIERLYFNGSKKQPARRQFQYLTLKRGIIFETAWLSWCEEVEDFLSQRID